jgi:Uma2 family endonuclease
MDVSYEAYLNRLDEDTHAEWVKGEMIVFRPPQTIHQIVLIFLHSLMNDFVSFFNRGVVIPAPFEMLICDGQSSRQPDLLFVSRDNLGRLNPERLNGPADLVVEIVAENSVSRDYHDKFYEYEQAGVREYWIIDPRPGEEHVDFYELTSSGHYRRISPDEYGRYHSVVLPGFWFRPDWLWEDMFPNAHKALSEIAPDAMRDSLR